MAITPIYEHYIIDLSSNNNFVQLPVMQGDGNNIRGVELELISRNTAYNIDIKNTIAIIAGKKPDGKEIFNTCTITPQGYIKVDVDYQMAASVGRSEYSVVLLDKKSNTKITSFPFYILVNKSTYDPSEIISKDEFTALTDALTKANKDYTYVMENAKKSADAAKLSEINAKSSETKAKESENVVKTNAASALASANTATAKASEASASAVKAKTSETEAKKSEVNAKTSETNAKTSETNAKTFESKALSYSDIATTKASEASVNAANAKVSETNACNSAKQASDSAKSASDSMNTTIQKANEASASANSASNSATIATNKATESSSFAKQSESFARGGTDTRDGEDIDNSKYYYEQARRISEGLNGALLPMGTISFAQLKSQNPKAGYLYNISDDFITDITFKEGAGHSYSKGTNVYYTADGKWDCFAGVNHREEKASVNEPINQNTGDFWLQEYN